MARLNEKNIATIPAGRLGIVALDSCAELGREVDAWLVKWRNERNLSSQESVIFDGYQKDSFLLSAKTPRFGSGEAKCTLNQSVRGDDIYIMVDVCNHSLTYRLGPYTNLMSPDDHYADLKRVIGAMNGKARRLNVIMPFLYESRQDKRTYRESLDCATALQELVNMGVENILTFDAHDNRIQNATPLNGFETVQPAYQFMKALLGNEDGLHIDNNHLMIISPDEGSMSRAIYLANILGVDIGMFYKRLDYTRMVNGKHPVAAFEFLGTSLEGKDIILIDDMISSGDTCLERARLLKERGANRIFICCTFGLFTNGLEKFDEAYKEGYFDRIYTTNLVYQTPELLEKEYYRSVNMSKYIALLIDCLNHDKSISSLLNPYDRIHKSVSAYMSRYENAETEKSTED